MTDSEIENEIVAKDKTAPRVTPDHIQSVISEETYFTAADGVKGKGGQVAHNSHLQALTFCVLTLKNGFTVTGESACASLENFDAEIGRKIARDNAVNKIWMLEGYLLRQRLSEQ
ncbi:Gp49 family protein [Tatumella terrea]|uniref:Gp49 family protein n=1 Tax=Tatumella terrea TaxID=419007 RepID=UPI0031DE1489